MRWPLKLGAILTCTASLQSQGPQVLTFHSTADGSEQPYALYVPLDYSRDKQWPLIVSLHGEDDNYRLELRRVFGKGGQPSERVAQMMRGFPPLPDVGYLVASPQARGNLGFQAIAERDVYEMLADIERRFRVDENRVYLTGSGMGGGGALWLGLTRPGVWAAVAAVAPSLPPGLEEFAGNALNLPVRLFHGEQDPVAPIRVTREWKARLTAAGAAVELVEYGGVRHNAWDLAYRNGAIFQWFSTLRRDPYPKRVELSSRFYAYAQCDWVRFDRIASNSVASIDAAFNTTGELSIETRALDGFTLNLKYHPSPHTQISIRLDGAPFRATKKDVSFRRGRKGWELGLAALDPGEKKLGAEGPIRATLSQRHVYIYGTMAADEAEIARRREMATRAADWSAPGHPLSPRWTVLSDREATSEALGSAALFVMGNAETNAWLAQHKALLPIELNLGAADFGLLYAMHIDGRDVVVNSGLPWWETFERAPPLLRFLPPVSNLFWLGDYLLFRGGQHEAVASGYFTREWRVPPEAAARLRASNAVNVLR